MAQLKKNSRVLATVWYLATILVLGLVGKTLYKVRTVKAMTCCASAFDCQGSGGGQCLPNYGCQQNSKPHMCC